MPWWGAARESSVYPKGPRAGRVYCGVAIMSSDQIYDRRRRQQTDPASLKKTGGGG